MAELVIRVRTRTGVSRETVPAGCTVETLRKQVGASLGVPPARLKLSLKPDVSAHLAARRACVRARRSRSSVRPQFWDTQRAHN